MQVVDHIPRHNSSAWPSRSSPRPPTEGTPLLAGSSSNYLRSKTHSTRVGWNNTSQYRIRGKAHPTKHRKMPSTIRSLPSSEWVMDLESSQGHRHPNSDQVSPPDQRSPSNPRPPSRVAIESLDNTHPGPTGTKPCPTDQHGSHSPSRPISLCLQNSGSVARDHLASERTFLSYVRTSLAIVSAGVALVQLFSAASTQNQNTHRLHVYIRPLGATAVIMGLSVLFIGVARYFMIQTALTKGYFPVARLATGFIATMLSVLVTLTFGILLAGKLEPKK